jgi:hypothetical protein
MLATPVSFARSVEMAPPTGHPADFTFMRARSAVEQYPAPETIDLAFIRNDEFLFYGLAAAAVLTNRAQRGLLESLAAFNELPLVQRWLREHWYATQCSHANTLARCVQLAWPHLHWEAVFAAARRRRHFEAHAVPGRDMFDQLLLHSADAVVMKCIYLALAEHSPDAVLRDLLTQLAREQSHNVSFFHRYLAAIGCESMTCRLQAAWAIARRLASVARNLQRLQLGLYRFRYGRAPVTRRDFHRLQHRIRPDMRRHFPHAEGAELLLSPLALPYAWHRPATYSTARLLHHLF